MLTSCSLKECLLLTQSECLTHQHYSNETSSFVFLRRLKLQLLCKSSVFSVVWLYRTQQSASQPHCHLQTTQTFPSVFVATTKHVATQSAGSCESKKRRENPATVKPELKSSTHLRNTLTSLLRLSLPLCDESQQTNKKRREIYLHAKLKKGKASAKFDLHFVFLKWWFILPQGQGTVRLSY